MAVSCTIEIILQELLDFQLTFGVGSGHETIVVSYSYDVCTGDRLKEVSIRFQRT